MIYRIVIIVLTLFTMVFSCAECISSNNENSTSSPHCNVVILIADALRADAIRSYGGKANTPNIDWIAKHGILFEHAYASSPWTVPSSVAIFTGNYPTIYDSRRLRESVKILVPDQERLLYEELSDRGYDVAYSIENWNARIHNALQGANKLDLKLNHDSLNLSKSVIEDDTGIYEEGMYDKTYSFLDFLLTVDISRPFFAIKWFMDPHAPYKPNKKFRDKIIIDGKKLPGGVSFFSRPSEKGSRAFSTFENAVNKNLYLATVESVDERVGFIINALKKRQLLESTVIVFTSDHGELFGEHGKWGHGAFGKDTTYFEELMRVPLLMSGPRILKGRRVQDAVSLISLMPTLKEYLGVRDNEVMQGESFLGVITRGAKFDHPIYLCNVVENDQKDALVEDGMKLVVRRDGAFQLFDLNKDPQELSFFEDRSRKDFIAMNDKIRKIRDNNAKRKQSLSKIGESVNPASLKVRCKIIKQLKSLGYIR